MNNVNNFNDFINEELTNKELIDELNGAIHIEVSPNPDGGWGVLYYKNGKKQIDGQFNTNGEVHEFLIDNDIEYGGRGGYEYMKRIRKKLNQNIPYSGYQDELITRGIDKDLL